MSSATITIDVCCNDRGPLRPSCHRADSRALLKQLKKATAEQPNITVKPGVCMGHCDRAVSCRITKSEGQDNLIRMAVRADLSSLLEELNKLGIDSSQLKPEPSANGDELA